MGRISLAHIEDSEVRKELLQKLLHEYLLPLDTNRNPKWGLMRPQEMVEHLIWALDISIGRIIVTCTTPNDKIPRFKKFLYSDMPTRRDFKNPVLGDQPLALVHPSLEAAKAALKLKIFEFYNHYQNSSRTAVHPVFGPLHFDEWERNHFKHSIHHLEQFGLL